MPCIQGSIIANAVFLALLKWGRFNSTTNYSKALYQSDLFHNHNKTISQMNCRVSMYEFDPRGNPCYTPHAMCIDYLSHSTFTNQKFESTTLRKQKLLRQWYTAWRFEANCDLSDVKQSIIFAKIMLR